MGVVKNINGVDCQFDYDNLAACYELSKSAPGEISFAYSLVYAGILGYCTRNGVQMPVTRDQVINYVDECLIEQKETFQDLTDMLANSKKWQSMIATNDEKKT